MDKAKSFFDFAKSFLAVMAALFPLLAWGYANLEAKAQAYVNEVMAPTIEGLSVQIMRQNEQIEQFNNSLNQLIQGQSAETSQSAEEARINRRILCYQEALANNSDATPCENIQ